MPQPNHSALRHRIGRIASELLALEIAMTGHRFAGDTAGEVEGLAQRLANLAKADKGRIELADVTIPGVELDRAA